MEQLLDDGAKEEPLWRRIVDFPLVAMLIAILIYAFATALAITIKTYLPIAAYGLKQAIGAVLTVGLVFAVYKLTVRHLGVRPRDDLAAQGALSNFGFGLASGALLFSLVVGIAALAGSYRITGCCSTRDLATDLFIACIMPAFMEELLFRGILFRWIEEFAGSWIALAITSALFGLVHILNPNATWFSSFAIAVEAGVLLGGAYMLTRSLWLPIGLHAAWNFTQGAIFDVPVSGNAANGLVEAKLSGPALLSGGGFGLEASVIALVVATGAGVWFVWLAARRGEVIQPWWLRRAVS
jgi:membrane protease YdiL (CAAX protease family)